MSELTNIVSILLKNLSEALLITASQIQGLNSVAPLSQTDENPESVSLEPRTFTKRDSYKIGDRVMIMVDGGILPIKARISDVLPNGLYLTYYQRQLKSSAREIRHEQILGLDPDR